MSPHVSGFTSRLASSHPQCPCSHHISNRLCTSTSQSKHPSSCTQHRDNLEADRILMPVEGRNSLRSQLGRDHGSSVEATPSRQHMDLGGFQNKPALAAHPAFARAKPVHDCSSAPRDTSSTTTLQPRPRVSAASKLNQAYRASCQCAFEQLLCPKAFTTLQSQEGSELAAVADI